MPRRSSRLSGQSAKYGPLKLVPLVKRKKSAKKKSKKCPPAPKKAPRPTDLSGQSGQSQPTLQFGGIEHFVPTDPEDQAALAALDGVDVPDVPDALEQPVISLDPFSTEVDPFNLATLGISLENGVDLAAVLYDRRVSDMVIGPYGGFEEAFHFVRGVVRIPSTLVQRFQATKWSAELEAVCTRLVNSASDSPTLYNYTCWELLPPLLVKLD